MNVSDNLASRLGFLLVCACILMLFFYWLMPGPYWKYGNYAFLCLTGICGMLVALTSGGGYQRLGWVVLVASVALGYATFDSRKRHDEWRKNFRKEAESRMMEELKKEASAVPK